MSLPISLLLAAIVATEASPQESIGRKGERSKFQITRAVWTQHMGTIPFVFCTDEPRMAEECARQHLRWIHQNMPAEVRGDPWWVGAVWNCGLHRCQKWGWDKTKASDSCWTYSASFAAMYLKVRREAKEPEARR